MIAGLLDEIAAYFQYLRTEHGDYAAFHNARIPLEGFMAKLAPYNISSSPCCLYVKSVPDVWDHCIQRQGKVLERCAQGPFCGACFAGMGEIVFPIFDLDETVLGFISLGGYRVQEERACGKMRHFSRRFGLNYGELHQMYRDTTRPLPVDTGPLQARIAPLCRMFTLLHRALSSMPAQGVESQRQSSLLSHAIVYIRKNYTCDLHTQTIADYCHCSTSTLSHIFKKQIGKSIPAYVRELRIENAQRLLLNTQLSVGQISDALGFCNSNYFCSMFKAETDLSPSEFRRANQSSGRCRNETL